MDDYLDSWDADWQARRDWNPEALTRAFRLREQGWTHAEIAGQLGLSVAQAYQLTAVRKKYEKTPDPDGTIGHLMTTVIFNLSHADSHVDKAMATQGATRQFNLEHAQKHLKEAVEHMEHLCQVLGDTYPKIGSEYNDIANDLEAL